jgi:hypothetical protein
VVKPEEVSHLHIFHVCYSGHRDKEEIEKNLENDIMVRMALMSRGTPYHYTNIPTPEDEWDECKV